MLSALKIAASVFGVYVGYAVLLFLFQRPLLFPRHLVVVSPTAKPPVGFESVWLETPAGRVETWYRPAPAARERVPAPLVIFSHGNAEAIDTNAADMAAFADLGVGILLVEFPGYGRSGGRPSQSSITTALLHAYDMFTRRPEVDGQRVVGCGRSLGGGAICALAARRPTAALILMSTFTSVRSFAKSYLVPQRLVRDPFDSLSVVQRYTGPILIFHGRMDEVVPLSHGMALNKAARKSRLILYDCGHNDLPPHWPSFWEAVGGFLGENGIIDAESK